MSYLPPNIDNDPTHTPHPQESVVEKRRKMLRDGGEEEGGRV